MTIRLNRELKSFCPDFAPVRQPLTGCQASFVEVKEQVDYYYHLPASSIDGETRRLKLRVEKGTGEVIYYRDRQENDARTSRFQLWDVTASPTKEILDAAVGVKVKVRKTRELWRKDNTVFNLDTVEGVGQVFEVEVPAVDGCDADGQIREYRELFAPFLGQTIYGSNEDLVSG